MIWNVQLLTAFTIKAGAIQVQGTFIGTGERCGNTNLSAIIPSLQLKLGYDCIDVEKCHCLL